VIERKNVMIWDDVTTGQILKDQMIILGDTNLREEIYTTILRKNLSNRRGKEEGKKKGG
jgi:hypothetical protein